MAILKETEFKIEEICEELFNSVEYKEVSIWEKLNWEIKEDKNQIISSMIFYANDGLNHFATFRFLVKFNQEPLTPIFCSCIDEMGENVFEINVKEFYAKKEYNSLTTDLSKCNSEPTKRLKI